MRVLLIIAAAAAAAVVLFVVLRPGGDDEDTTQTTAVTTTAPAETETQPAETEITTETEPEETTPTETTPKPKPKPEARTVRLAVRGGRPVGGIKRVKVKKGERVRLVVRADVSDHVHLHGYDVMRNVGPGKPAQLVFRATIAGVFEVELEDRQLPIAEIEVRP